MGPIPHNFEFEALAAAQDERRFCEIVDEINWAVHSPNDFITAIRLGLAVGAYQKAAQLARIGNGQYPDQVEIQKYVQILAPAKIKPDNSSPQPEGAKDIQWLKEHRQEYSGQWVALLHGELLGAAPTLKELTRQVGSPKGTAMLVTRVY